MHRIFISIMVFYAVADPVRCSDFGKDGFNFYKDYLRARNDDLMENGERMVYFYRTPLRLYPGLVPTFEQEYRKRNENVFKNHMLNKEAIYVQIPIKRTSKTALSYMMQNKLDPFYSELRQNYVKSKVDLLFCVTVKKSTFRRTLNTIACMGNSAMEFYCSLSTRFGRHGL